MMLMFTIFLFKSWVLILQREAPILDPNSSFFSIDLIIAIVTVFVFSFFGIRFLEAFLIYFYHRPLYVHGYIRLRKMPKSMEQQLFRTTPFYKRLGKRYQKYFRHRVLVFLEETAIVGRDGCHIDDEKRIAIAALAIQLTFGMRHYILPCLSTIVFYPSSFYSVFNQEEHVGEFNPILKTIVVSWEHFNAGNMANDGVNLGIHELTHAIHHNAIKGNDTSSELFYANFLSLEQYLKTTTVREQLVAAHILRPYAYTDKFEFIAVLVEVFMESPEKLKQLFPKLYQLVQQMLNYRY